MKYKKAKIKNFLQARRGFSLIESLVASSILLLAITGTLTIASKSIGISSDARDQVTASYLAQEGVEFVRNARDSNVLSSVSWLSGLVSCALGNTCTIDVPNNEISRCSGACPPFLLSDAGIYNYRIGNPTIFRREIKISELISNQEIVVEVTMRWKKKVLERTLVIREHLLNWQ